MASRRTEQDVYESRQQGFVMWLGVLADGERQGRPQGGKGLGCIPPTGPGACALWRAAQGGFPSDGKLGLG